MLTDPSLAAAPDNGLPAEITYTEWLESPYNAMGLECQGCHMDTYSGQAAVGGPQRENLHRHDFVGVDVALIDNFPNKNAQMQKIQELLANSVTMSVETPDSVVAGGMLNMSVPYAIRDGAQEFIAKIPVFEMEKFRKTVVIFN